MGLFSKLKANFNHGDVKVRVQAPSSVAANQVISVTATITADSPQSIKSVKAELKAEAREQGISMGRGNQPGLEAGGTTKQTVAVAENREAFTINPGETKSVTLELFMNGNSGSAYPLGQTGAANPLGGVVQSIVSAVQGFEHINYIYTVHASADVDGISLDPGDSQPIQILPASPSTPPPVAPSASPPTPPQL